MNALQQDIAKFKELQIVFRNAIHAPSFDGLQPAWREMEEIKNRHGGMPPVGNFSPHQGETPALAVALPAVKSDVARRDPLNGHENSSSVASLSKTVRKRSVRRKMFSSYLELSCPREIL